MAAYASDTDRLILTRDDDFFTELDIDRTAGVLFQRDQTLSSREGGISFTKWRNTSISPTSPWNTLAGTGCRFR
ncbi:hypothetical protein ACFQPA_13250 [Halomarina halobia]|uniref:hypothetical protein n=1 Tax=Halomarina halobia TaxID=3033386 RepID=UPI0034A2FBAD